MNADHRKAVADQLADLRLLHDDLGRRIEQLNTASQNGVRPYEADRRRLGLQSPREREQLAGLVSVPY